MRSASADSNAAMLYWCGSLVTRAARSFKCAGKRARFAGKVLSAVLSDIIIVSFFPGSSGPGALLTSLYLIYADLFGIAVDAVEIEYRTPFAPEARDRYAKSSPCNNDTTEIDRVCFLGSHVHLLAGGMVSELFTAWAFTEANI